ncbi:MAG: DUF2162 family putative transporter, partial [bacterium]|nr:DUF2162 family putative transporter [bacterium]
ISFGMLGIGFYFLAALVIPAKIEEAKGIYQAFLTETGKVDLTNSIGVLALLVSAMLIGFFANIHHREKECTRSTEHQSTSHQNTSALVTDDR